MIDILKSTRNINFHLFIIIQVNVPKFVSCILRVSQKKLVDK